MQPEAPRLTLTQTWQGTTTTVEGRLYPSICPWNIFHRFDRMMYDKTGMILPDREWKVHETD